MSANIERLLKKTLFFIILSNIPSGIIRKLMISNSDTQNEDIMHLSLVFLFIIGLRFPTIRSIIMDVQFFSL